MKVKRLNADISKSKLAKLLGALEEGAGIEITYAPACETQVLQPGDTPSHSHPLRDKFDSQINPLNTRQVFANAFVRANDH